MKRIVARRELQRYWAEEGKPMTVAEKLKLDIEEKLDSIRLSWVQAAQSLSSSERAEVRRSIESHFDDLKELMSK